MGDNTRYGNPAEYEVDLHSIYAAYLGDFDAQNIDWWDASWGGYFRSFNEFLGFGWDAMVVVDSITGRAHIGAKREQIALFARMIKTRFGETLDKEPPSLLPLSPAPARSRTLHRTVHITDLQSYKKLATTMSPAELLHLRARVRMGEPAVITALFHAGAPDTDGGAAAAGVRTNGQGYSWACIKSTWWEKGGPPQGFIPGHGRTVMAKPGQGGKGLILEVGLAALRCANLRAVDVWPPIPDKNYRKAHYVIEEWVDKRTNTERPSYPRAFGFGRSQFIAEKSVERIVDASIQGLASHETDAHANTLILLSVGEPQPIPLPASSVLAPNIMQLDVLQLELALLQQAQRQGVPGVGDRRQPLASLRQLLHHLQIPVAPHAPLGNAGNEAFYTVLAFQKLLMRDTRLPDQLFTQPTFAQQDYFAHPPIPPYAGGTPYGSPYGAPLPLPPPIRADGRKGSSSSLHRISQASADYEPPSFQAPITKQHTGDSHRRPASMTARRNSSSRQPSQLDIPRSQSVYWDDAEFSADGRPPRRYNSGNDSAPSSPDQRSPDHRPTRNSTSVPPSSLRHSQVFPTPTSSNGPTLPSSRSVSFHDERRPATIRSMGSSSGSKDSGSADTGRLGSRSNSGTALGPSHLSASHTSSGASGSGTSASSANDSSAAGRATSEATVVPDSRARKTKSGSGVKHITGALAKFWVD
ncbi:hypothetical protein VHUM_02451 [Vanrija humicola]|uniref:Gfd2/YDR514C-like C-terminal domain-containing protein n=1 Tax=Vanrija humicola TaxID=5417 RepID=A0A7D8V0M8_VANHU|nr:hypothetical protein VHUM_02451 [Vanrija humicola]